MPHISSKKISRTVYMDSVTQLLQTITGRSTTHTYALQNLLTQTETIMLAKRLALIALLTQDLSPYHISQILRMSPSTVSRFSSEYKKGKYAHLVSHFNKQKNKKQFWNTLETFLRAGMPRQGKNRWKFLDELI